MDKKLEPKFSFLDSNALLPRRSARITRRSHIAVDGQENSAKRAKLDPELTKKLESNVAVLPKPKEVILSVKEVPTRDRKVDGDFMIIKDQWMLTSDCLKDVLRAELQLERRLQLSKEYCSKNSVIDAVQRELLLEWLLELQCTVKVESEVFHLAVTILDCFLDSSILEASDVHTAATSAFWLSYKYYHGRVELKSVIKQNKIPKKKLLLFERQILQGVDFNLQFTNSMSLIHYYIFKIFDGLMPRLFYYCSCYFIDLMFYHSEFMRETYHNRAIAALFSSLSVFQSPLRTKMWDNLSAEKKIAIRKIHCRLLILLDKVRTNELFRKDSVLYRRYASSKFRRVSQHPALHQVFNP